MEAAGLLDPQHDEDDSPYDSAVLVYYILDVRRNRNRTRNPDPPASCAREVAGQEAL